MAAPEQSKTGLSQEIVAFANSARLAQQLLNEDNMTPMAIKEFSFQVSYDFGETYKEGLEMGFAAFNAKMRANAAFEQNSTKKLTVNCTLVPVLVFAPSLSGDSSADASNNDSSSSE